MAEYRIEYSIQRAASDDSEFVEIGFGSSGTWDGVDVHMVGTDIQSRAWETSGDMPDPETVDEES